MDLFKEINEMRDKKTRAILFALLERIKRLENAIIMIAPNGPITQTMLEHKPED